MSRSSEPNPPARRAEDFPRTTTIPAGWHMDSVESDASMAAAAELESTCIPETVAPVAASVPQAEPENLFSRRLEPFPSVYGMSGMML